MTATILLSLLYKKKKIKKMGTSITIAEFLIISIFTIIGYGVITTLYNMWFKK